MDIPTVDVPVWNADNLCRACVIELYIIKSTGEATACVNIFEKPDILPKLAACISNEFSTRSKYSKYLCMDCYQNVNAFYEFRKMCIDSMRHFDELLLQHTEDVLSFEEEEKPFAALASEIVIKEEAMPDFETACAENEGTSILLNEGGDYMKEVEKKATTMTSSTIKNMIVGKGKRRKKRTMKTVEKESVGLDDLASSAYGKNERRSDYEDNKSKEDAEDSSFNEFPDSQEDIDSEKEKYRTKSKPKAARSIASKRNKGKSKNATIYQCDICPSRFLVEHRLIAHKREHAGLKPYPCTHEGCDKSFNRWNSLSTHRKEHDGTNTIEFPCDQDGCDKVYKYKAALNIHKRKVHKLGPEIKSHICEICGKVFKSSTILRQHRYTHKDASERPFVCDQAGCTRSFANKDKLKVHLKRHAGIKNYVCSHCGMRKTTQNELTVHMNYHTLERTWPCRLCKKVCHNAGNLKRHILTVHEGVKDYACRYCDQKFAKPDTLKYHEMRHTGEKPNVCTECGKSFIQPVALRTHMKIHGRQQQERFEITNNLTNSKLSSIENESKIKVNG